MYLCIYIDAKKYGHKYWYGDRFRYSYRYRDGYRYRSGHCLKPSPYDTPGSHRRDPQLFGARGA